MPAANSSVLELKPKSIRSSLAWEKSRSRKQPRGRAPSAHTFPACCFLPCDAASRPACWGGASWAVGLAHGSAETGSCLTSQPRGTWRMLSLCAQRLLAGTEGQSLESSAPPRARSAPPPPVLPRARCTRQQSSPGSDP